MSYAQAIGNFLTLVTPNEQVHFHFQNFYIGKPKQWLGLSFDFMPFGFSGVTVDVDGGNVEAQLVFPNTELTRSWSTTAVEDAWVVRVRVIAVDPDGDAHTLIHRYVAQVTSGQWDQTALTLTTSSVLDAVGGDVPNRRLNRQLVGALPVTDAIRL